MTLDLAVRASLLLGMALAAARLLPRASAATRHACVRAAMAATFALPLLSVIAPSLTLPVSVAERAGMLLQTGNRAGRAAFDFAQATKVAGDGPRHGRRGESLAVSVAPVLPAPLPSAGATWLLGVAMVSLYFALGQLRLSRVRRRASPAPLDWTGSASRLAARLHLRGTPAVLVSSDIAGPIVAGIWRPAVIAPVESMSWSETRRETVLLHELAHVARKDVAAQTIAHAVCALHWFNPLAWIALVAMRRERERACDDAVLGSGVMASTYASELLAIAARATCTRTPATALSMARPTEIEGRLLAILARRPRHMSAAARFGVPAIASVAAMLVAGATQAATPGSRPPALQTGGLTANTMWIFPDTLPPAHRGGSATSDAEDDSHPESRERRTVALALTPGTDVIPALISALADEHSGVREKAVVGLMWRRDARVVPALIAAAADADGGVRKKAIVALALSGDARATPVLNAARRDADPEVRDAAEKLGLLRGEARPLD
jgi:hypothetical protein